MSQTHSQILSTTVTSTSSLDATQMNNGAAICNDETMHVETSNKPRKENYCIFCGKMQKQLARHLEYVHRNESDVKKFAVLPKNNRERKKIMEILNLIQILN